MEKELTTIDDFDKFEKTINNDSKYPLEICYNLLEEVSEISIIKLYNSIDNFLFQNINYCKVASNMPQWVCDGGISPESVCTKDFYEKMRNKATHPIFKKFIYHYDIWSIIAAIQDRISAVAMYMRQFYDLVPCIAGFRCEEYTLRSRNNGERETQAHILLNGIFVAYASIFDLISKIANEQFLYNYYDFSTYNKMKSKSVLYEHSLRNIDSSLKSKGLLFSAPLVIRKIETFRNEYVHNGSWDLRCSIYCTVVNGEPADVIYSPDMDEYGNFIKSGSRNKFYAQNNAINFQLPDMIKEATIILKKTIDQLCILYQTNTILEENSGYTKECIQAIMKYYENLNNEVYTK